MFQIEMINDVTPQAQLSRSGTDGTVLVIDDDPTGAQTVAGVPLIFGVQTDLIVELLASGTPCLFVLTNSRALTERGAEAAVAAVMRAVDAADVRPPLVVSRGDSTLRGHLRGEIAAIEQHMSAERPCKILVPAFVEAGRFTVDDVHYVEAEDGTAVPVAATPFARDARFGFASSNLRDYLIEIGAATASERIRSVDADLIDDEQALEQTILDEAGGWIIGNVRSAEGLATLASSIRRAHALGRSVIVRSGPSLLAPLTGLGSGAALSDDELMAAFGPRRGHGLTVVGSHVPLTTQQLAALDGMTGLARLELGLDAVSAADAAERRRSLAAEAARLLSHGDVLLSTPRKELQAGVEMHEAFARGLVDVVRMVSSAVSPAWVIGKGGITSHETAAEALGIRAGRVIGQLFERKVSVLAPTHAPERSSGMPYVIFPGNVGSPTALRQAIERMRSLTRTEHAL